MNHVSQTIAAAVEPALLRSYVQKVYAWMVGGLLLTAGTAFGVASSPELITAIFGTWLIWPLLIAPFGIVLLLSAFIDKMKPSTAATAFIMYSIVNGITFSAIFLLYELGSIAQVFGIAAGMFAIAALYGFTTKRDLTSIGSFLMMGLFGIIIASVVAFVTNSSAVHFAVSVLGVIIFTGLTAFDMQRLKTQSIVMYQSEALVNKSAILGALGLYLNLINMFLLLLRLLGDRD
jgi:uncharacterized protein